MITPVCVARTVSVGGLHRVRLARLDRVHRLCETEVQHLHGAVRTDLDVRGLEIAMDDAELVGGFERIDDLSRDGSASVDGIGPRAMSADRSSPSTSSMTSARRAGSSRTLRSP